MPDTLQPLQKRPLIKGALKPPPIRVDPPSYAEKPRPKSEVTIMKQDWQSDRSNKIYRTTICSTSVPQPFVNPPSELRK